ncbi:hypothetical protein [Streptomyces olivochromogenes]|uniref:hypothetical protein n=1 Tax=Streptomyces olivochromogenes TaxID=1963 RepID=UPI0036C22C03
MVEQIREFDVQFLSDRGDLGAAETAELLTRPVECEIRGALRLSPYGRVQRCVEKDGRVETVHALGNGVVAHEVTGADGSVSG